MHTSTQKDIPPQATDPRPTSPTVSTAPTAPAAAPRRSGRDPFFDNAKFLAILLVVSGHAVEGLLDVPQAHAAYLLVYMFHMPMFIVLTGYLSRNFTFSSGKARKLITNLVAPYLIFETAYSIYFWAVLGKDLEISLLKPSYVMWFLMALFLWRLSTPVWQQLRWPLGIAVAISLLSFMSSLPRELALSKVLGLIPFYVLGLTLRPEHFELFKKPLARVLGVLTLAGALIFAGTVGQHMPDRWIYWSNAHHVLGVDNVTGTLMRLGMLVTATVLVAAFLAVVPARRTWFTALGATTLYAYLLHGLGIKTLSHFGMYKLDWLHTIPGALLVATGGAVLGILLCVSPVVRAMRWAVEPKMAWAFTRIRRPPAHK